MKFDGSFVIVINLSISLFCSQTGGFFVLNFQRSNYVGDKSNNPRLSQARDRNYKFKVFLLYLSISLTREMTYSRIVILCRIVNH